MESLCHIATVFARYIIANYFMFVRRKYLEPVFIMNTRIYSCNLIRNEVPFRWRGRYNEDTILSLDLLKAGWCTVQFNAFLQFKMETQKLAGGNSDEFYFTEGSKDSGAKYAVGGTDAKSEMLVNVHPDVATLTHKFSRTHHEVDYSRFKQRLIYLPGVVPEPGVNNYGMELRTVDHYRGGA